jgi:SOS-response transcriptional repressor LexA
VPLDSYFQGQLYDWLMPIGDRIRQARIKAGMRNQQMLADAIGVSVQSISQWETGTTTPTRANESKLAEVLGVSQIWLSSGRYDSDPERANVVERAMKQVPLVNRVTAGRWTDSGPPEFPVDTIFLDPTIRCIGPSFALEVDGESMEPEFQTGDIVIIDTGVEPLPGDFVVAATDDNQGTFKKYRPRNVGPKGERVIDLVPLNQDYPILTLSEQNPGRIVGTMVEHRRFRRRRPSLS